jgi:mannose-6-phosphate isomerase-like protein (cupin superfamily)
MTQTPKPPVVLTHQMIEALPELPLAGRPGVTRRVLWRGVDSEAGVLEVAAGHQLGAHTHRANHHHFWVLGGNARVLGDEVGPGSYVHIPDQVEHNIEATDSGSCTVFYLYLREVG